jgi:hypothetical protein
MRFAIQFEVPVEVGNAFEKDPKALELLAKFMEPMKPEAGYFCSTRRYGIMIVNADSQEELNKMIFPIWHNFKVYPQVDPVFTLEEIPGFYQKLPELVNAL